MTPITLTLGDRSVTAAIDGAGHVVIDDSRFVVTTIEPGVYLVDDGQRRWQVAVADDGDARWVSVDGRVAVLDVASPTRLEPRRRTAARGAMMAPMPATVVTVLVTPGQAVAEGETVLVLEAMKMELPVRAPKAGVVAAVHCQQGELVQPGVSLVELA